MITIRHKKLYAFFNSKLINSLLIIMEMFLILMYCFTDVKLPIICSLTCLILIIGYSISLALGKVKKVVVNKYLSELSSLYTLYFLIVVAIKSPSVWWSLFAAVSLILIFFVSMIAAPDKILTLRMV